MLAAERHRRATGHGQLARLSLADVALWMVGNLGHIAEVEVAAVTYRLFHPLVSYENFRREKLVFFASVNHPLAKKKSSGRWTYPECPS